MNFGRNFHVRRRNVSTAPSFDDVFNWVRSLQRSLGRGLRIEPFVGDPDAVVMFVDIVLSLIADVVLGFGDLLGREHAIENPFSRFDEAE
ncbi:hypothetical protein [Bradyrhizobium sp. CCGUVB23]|uniref:hypothetical protein n=1 Tax=Bradyrhizobium sp. CCGUVB23 TaxID=2949630 RepID=UPI0020B4208C|nr:hypothetical protein [Bradyrhizobium sp. CCGUVB23]MCP3460391.1 hypothetical protein [Bradyrhizobium sp. CCGUVB23]